MAGGSCSSNTLDAHIDRTGYIAGDRAGCNIPELNTSRAFSNYGAWYSLCVQDGIYRCGNNGRSCHYVHERNPSLVWLPNGDLALMSQQSYPYGSDEANANGVFRVTQFRVPNSTSGANRTGDVLPQLNENVGELGATVYQAVVRQGKVLSLPVSQDVNSTHIHNLYERNGGIKIASFPITKTGYSDPAALARPYHTADFDVPGQPLLLSDNGSSVWMANKTTINKYHYDGVDQLNSKTSFHLASLHEGSSRVLAIGHNSDWLYVARHLDDNRIMIERSSMVDRLPDPNFMLTLNTPGAGIDYELTVDEGNNIILLPRGTVHLALESDNGHTNGSGESYDSDGHKTTALKAKLPEFGGCVNWKTVDALSFSAGDPVHVTAVVPESKVISSSPLAPTPTPTPTLASTLIPESSSMPPTDMLASSTLAASAPPTSSSLEASTSADQFTTHGQLSIPLATSFAMPEKTQTVASSSGVGSGQGSEQTLSSGIDVVPVPTSALPMETQSSVQGGATGHSLTQTPSQPKQSIDSTPSKAIVSTVDEMTTMLSSLSVTPSEIAHVTSTVVNASRPEPSSTSSVTPLQTSGTDGDSESSGTVVRKIVVPVVGGTITIAVVATATGVYCLVKHTQKNKKKGRRKHDAYGVITRDKTLDSGAFGMVNPAYQNDIPDNEADFHREHCKSI